MRNSVHIQSDSPSGIAIAGNSGSFSSFNPNPLFVLDVHSNTVVHLHLVDNVIPKFDNKIQYTANSFLSTLPESNLDYSELWNLLLENKYPKSKKVHFKKSGQWYLMKFVPQKIENRFLIGMSWTNITAEEQKSIRAEKWMMRFKKIYDSSPLGVVTSNPDGSLIANQAFCDWIGYTKNELQYLTKYDITHPEDLNVHQECLQLISEGKKTNGTFEKRYITKNGDTLLANVHVSGAYKVNGTLETVMAVIEDITEKKVTEQSLRHSLTSVSYTHLTLPTILLV